MLQAHIIPSVYISAALLIVNFNSAMQKLFSLGKKKKKAIELLSLFLVYIINQREVTSLVLQTCVALILGVHTGYVTLQDD